MTLGKKRFHEMVLTPTTFDDMRVRYTDGYPGLVLSCLLFEVLLSQILSVKLFVSNVADSR